MSNTKKTLLGFMENFYISYIKTKMMLETQPDRELINMLLKLYKDFPEDVMHAVSDFKEIIAKNKTMDK